MTTAQALTCMALVWIGFVLTVGVMVLAVIAGRMPKREEESDA